MGEHKSDCAVHNAPAYAPDQCDCGLPTSPPWRLEVSESVSGSPHTAEAWIVGAQEERIARIFGYGSSLPWEANARLIAAAPEMYEALKWAIRLAELVLEQAKVERLKAGHDDIGREAGHPGLWPEEVAKKTAAYAALTKAEGKEE